MDRFTELGFNHVAFTHEQGLILKKMPPPSSPLATSTRSHILAIIQLCLVFTFIASRCGYPFMGELFVIKSHQSLYESVMGKGDPFHAELFSQLPKEEREFLEQKYQSLQKKAESSFSDKWKRSMNILVFFLPRFEKTWILLSLAISIFVLLCMEGATHAAWILPFVVLAYAFDSGEPGPQLPDRDPYPPEKYIVQRYLKQPLSNNISQQQQQLRQGWQLYLVSEWTDAAPSEDPLVFSRQVNQGKFFFDLSRAHALPPIPSDRMIVRTKPSLAVLVLSFFWNVFFAWSMNRIKISPHASALYRN